jgi:hypothetical protein
MPDPPPVPNSAQSDGPRGRYRASPEDLCGALDDLVRLVDDCVPRRYYGSEGGWPPIAAGLIARLADVVAGVAALVRSGRFSEAVSATRSVYEHSITFCWLAIDPDRHLALWRGSALAHQRALHNDALQYDQTVLSEAELAATEGTNQRKINQLAARVDAYWPKYLPGFRARLEGVQEANILTMQGLYTGLFRPASRSAHAQLLALDVVMDQEPQGRTVVRREGSSGLNELVHLAVPLTVIAFQVSERLFRWPDSEAAEQINTRFHDALADKLP